MMMARLADRPRKGQQAKRRQPAPSAPPSLPPLRPRPKLALILAIIVAAWIAALLVMWYVTVRQMNYNVVHSDVNERPEAGR